MILVSIYAQLLNLTTYIEQEQLRYPSNPFGSPKNIDLQLAILKNTIWSF